MPLSISEDWLAERCESIREIQLSATCSRPGFPSLLYLSKTKYPSKNLSFLPFYAKKIAGMLLKSIRSSHNVCETFSDFSRMLTVQWNISAGENGSA